MLDSPKHLRKEKGVATALEREKMWVAWKGRLRRQALSIVHTLSHGHRTPAPVRKQNFAVATRDRPSHKEAMAVTGPV